MKKILNTLLIACLTLVSCNEKEDDNKFVAVASVSLDKTELTLTEGDNAVLSATVLPEQAFNKAVKWSSSDESVATVSKGTVTARKEGTAVITVTTDEGGKTASCTVSVKAKIIYSTKVSFSKKSLELMVGDTEFLTYEFYPEGSVNEGAYTTSTDYNVAAYGDGGIVTAYNVGTAVITLTATAGTQTIKDECVVTVIPKVYPVEEIILNKSEVTMYVGDSETLAATILPENATNKNFVWATSEDRIVSIDDNGTIKGLTSGSAIITAITEDGNKKATCKVDVKGYDPFVDLGLSVEWASFNLGSDTPEGYGDYYAWGELTTYYEDGYAHKDQGEVKMKDGKGAGYDWPSYKYCAGTSRTLTKYVMKDDAKRFGNNGFYDDINKLEAGDDVARSKTGGRSRIPTSQEARELIDNCDWTWIEYRGVAGHKVSSKVSPDKWIFIPAAGNRYQLRFWNQVTLGAYWTSSLYYNYPDYAEYLSFSKPSAGIDRTDRACGLPIRPVRDK